MQQTSNPVLYIAITSHGFGHAVRICSVVEAVKKLYPEILLVLVTTAPRWLLESYIQADFIYRPRTFDVGVIQADSLKMDKVTTLEKLQHIYQKQDAIIAGEVNFIKTNGVGLILADIPPLATKIAEAAGIPCWMMSNFGWDFIYRDWGEDFEKIADWISKCYGKCERLYRLPMSEEMSAFPNIIDVGLTGGKPHYSDAELREDFNLNSPKDKTILLTFGGLGLNAIPYQNLESFPDWQFITFDANAPDLGNLAKITKTNYRPVDFMPLCDLVISKPGYSTFAEALRMDVPIISLTREGFAETPLLLSGIKKFAKHKIISTEEFFQGNWSFLNQDLEMPTDDFSLSKNGTEVIANAVVDYFKHLT